MVQQLPINNNNSAQSSGSGIQLVKEQREISIVRDASGGFGFNVLGGTDHPHIPGYTGIFISHIRRPDLEINEGDQIISVNGIMLEGKTHEEAVKILKDALSNSTFLIELNSEQRIASRVNYTSEDTLHTAVFDGATDESTSLNQTSLPSSSVSTASGSNVLTRNSSTSTMNQSTLREDGTLVDRRPWVVEEDDNPGNSSMKERLSEPGPSLVMEILFVSIGAIAIGVVLYFGFKRFSRGGRI